MVTTMIVTETVTIDGKDFIHTYSDNGHTITRDSIEYAEALDPVDSGRAYEETDTLAIEEPDNENELMALVGRILMGEVSA
jgi:hypothetical protein